MAETNGVSGSKGKSHKCKDCKIKFPDITAYVEHLESKEHVKGVMKNKYGEKYLEAKANLASKTPEEKTTAVQPKNPIIEKPTDNKEVKATDSDTSSSSGEDEDVYPCELCQKVCTGYLSYKLHLEGKKHQKMVLKKKLLTQMEKEQIIPKSDNQPKKESLMDQLMPNRLFASSDIVCQVCNKSCTGPEVYKQHCKSKAHMKKLLMNNVAKGIDTLGLSPTPNQNEESGDFNCKVCEKAFSGPIPYIQHLESAVHLKQAKQVEDRVKIKDLIVSSEEDSKFQCKECGKMFSGPIPFNAHIKSSYHGKIKKKNALLESLEAQHPELFKGAPADDDSDTDVVLGCEVCHIALTGPEVAKEHFSSLKHKKALKKKSQFQKYKKQMIQDKAMGTKSLMKQRTESLKTGSDSDEFDIISNPDSHDVPH